MSYCLLLCMLSGTYNRNTHLFDVNTFQPVKDLTGHLGTITGMTLNPSGNFLFTSSSDNTVQVSRVFVDFSTLHWSFSGANLVVFLERFIYEIDEIHLDILIIYVFPNTFQQYPNSTFS